MNRRPAQKGRDNVAAIRLAAKLVAEGRPATREEQETLALYIGWGSIKNVFAKDPKQVWEREVQADLKTLLTDEEYRQAAESVAYLVGHRHGVAPVSDAYLSGFIEAGESISRSIRRTLDVERVMRAAGAVEGVMGLAPCHFEPARKATKR